MIESAHWRLGDGGFCGKPVDDEHEALKARTQWFSERVNSLRVNNLEYMSLEMTYCIDNLVEWSIGQLGST